MTAYSAAEAAERVAQLDWERRAAVWDGRPSQLLAEYYRRLLPFWPAHRLRVFPDDPDVLAALELRLSTSQRDWVARQCSALPARVSAVSRRLVTVILTGAILEANGELTRVENPGAVLLELFEAGFELTYAHGAIDVVYAEGMTTVPRPDRSTVAARAAADARQVIGDIEIRVERPVPPEDDTLAEDWTQLTVYGQPLWGHTFADLTRRISIETSADALVLFDRYDPARLEHLFAVFGIGQHRHFAIRVAESREPLLDGYLRCLRFAPGPADWQPTGLADIMTAFITAEARDFRVADPGDRFDDGTMDVGFGLLVERTAGHRQYRLWSRPVYYHK